MKDFSKITLDGKNKKIVFSGECFEILSLCEAMCCREWDVHIAAEEFQSGLYRAKMPCPLIGKDCENVKTDCINRAYRLEKKEDGSCVYLNEENKCSIYENRPHVCRNFSCKGGWKLSFTLPLDKQQNKITRTTRKFKERLSDNMKFIKNPLVELKSIFFSKEKKEISFVKKILNKCGRGLITGRSSFQNNELDDNSLLCIFNLFDGKNILGDILKNYNENNKIKLAKEDFYRIVWIFYYQNIIIFLNQT